MQTVSLENGHIRRQKPQGSAAVMIMKILTPESETWREIELLDYLFVNTCKRCGKRFDTPQKERIYCGDKCQFATWNDNKILNRTGHPTVKTPNRS